jgi:hypothetical protein
MKKPALWRYVLAGVVTALVITAPCSPLADIHHYVLAMVAGFAVGLANGWAWLALYRRRMRRYLSQPWEFDCPRCERHIVRFSRLDERRICAECLAIPGWFRDPHLVRLFDPAMLGREETVIPGGEKPNGS